MDVGWMEMDGGRDNLRDCNRQTRGTFGRSCARAWALSSAWVRKSSYLLIRGLRDGRLYTVKEVHCRQHISNVLVVLCAHWVMPQQTVDK